MDGRVWRKVSRQAAEVIHMMVDLKDRVTGDGDKEVD